MVMRGTGLNNSVMRHSIAFLSINLQICLPSHLSKAASWLKSLVRSFGVALVKITLDDIGGDCVCILRSESFLFLAKPQVDSGML
jgi:hypothetical protein